MSKPLSITVITKMTTPNAGNQAVSTELIRLLERTYPDASLFAGWRQRGLEQYSFAKLQRAGSDPLLTLDKWAGHILQSHVSSKDRSRSKDESLRTREAFKVPQNGRNMGNIVELSSKVLPLAPRIFNKGSLALNAPFDYWRGYGRNYGNWLDVLRRSDWVVYSPAGEVTNEKADYLVRDFLGLRIAQRLGARVAAVNQSIEIDRPQFLRLLGQIYSGFDAIVVRDPVSAQLLMDNHVSRERIKLAPDTAFLAQPASLQCHEPDETAAGEEIRPGTVGISIVPNESFDLVGWSRIIQVLQTMGKQVLFVSNQMCDVHPVTASLQKLYGVQVMSRQYDYNEYIRVLSRLELIISERYHTCVFSAIANRPFIPLRIRQMRKMPGITSLLNYAIPPVDTTSSDWQDSVIAHVHCIYSHYDRVAAYLREAVSRAAKLAEQNAKWNQHVDLAGQSR